MEQAKAILDLRLQRLTALGRDEISEQLDTLAVEIADYLDILRSRARVQTIVKTELAEVKSQFATPRRTVIIDQENLFLVPQKDAARKGKRSGHQPDAPAREISIPRWRVGLV